jgi:eukaryotic-like serine/threonine-protein kinase
LIAGIVATTYQATLAREAQARAEAERERAEKHFASVRRIARETIFELNNDLKRIPGTLELRTKALDRAVSYLEELTKGATQREPALLMETGSGWIELSHIVGAVEGPGAGKLQRSLDYKAKGVQLLSEALQAAPTNADIAAKLVNGLRGIGSDSGTLGDMNASRFWLQQAVDLGEVFSMENGNTRDVRRQTAMALTLHAFYVRGEGVGETRRRVEHSRRARAILEKLLTEDLDAKARSIATSSLGDVLGTLSDIAGRREDGSVDEVVTLEWVDRAVNLAQRVTTEDISNVSASNKLAMAHLNAAVDYKKFKKLEHAASHAERALELFERLTAASGDAGSNSLSLYAEAALAETLLESRNPTQFKRVRQLISSGRARFEKLPNEITASINVGRAVAVFDGVEAILMAFEAEKHATSDQARRRFCDDSVAAYRRAESFKPRLVGLIGQSDADEMYNNFLIEMRYCEAYSPSFPKT